MLDRRLLLGGLIAVGIPASLRGQEKPKLIVLGSNLSGEIMSYWRSYSGKSLKGWLLCNGAEASRSAYGDLFAQLGTRAGPGDGSTTFNLPVLPFSEKDGVPVSGTAICPSWEFGSPAGSTLTFNLG